MDPSSKSHKSWEKVKRIGQDASLATVHKCSNISIQILRSKCIVYYFFPYQIKSSWKRVLSNLNEGQPSKLFWFEDSKHLKTSSEHKSPFFLGHPVYCKTVWGKVLPLSFSPWLNVDGLRDCLTSCHSYHLHEPPVNVKTVLITIWYMNIFEYQG